MSLESISALRSLTQVREQSATNQNDNLEKVQSSVQQVSVSEAQRTDGMFLQEAKAQYEVLLNQATVERIESQLAREKTSLAVTGFITGATVILAGVDAGMNLAKDFKGGSKLGDPSSGADVKGINANDSKTLIDGNNHYTVSGSGSKTVETLGNSAITPELALKYGLVTKDEKGKFDVTNKGKFFGVGVDKDSNTINYDRSRRADYDPKKPDENKSLSLTSETVFRTTVSGNGVQHFQAATITQEDLKLKAQQFGIDATKINSFEDLMRENPKAAEQLFNENGRSVKLSEAKGASAALKSSLRQGLVDAAKGGSTANVDQNIKEIFGSLDAKLDKDNAAGSISTKDKAKYVFNALITFAQTVVPQFQALMAAKDKVENTEIELQAAVEKLAAARKKLSQIQNLIQSVGGDGLGNSNNQAETGI